jgi:hypothetical protein
MEESSTEVVCPATFVIPEHPEDRNVYWVTHSGCAIGCVNPYWLPHEWNQLAAAALAIPIVGESSSSCILLPPL